MQLESASTQRERDKRDTVRDIFAVFALIAGMLAIIATTKLVTTSRRHSRAEEAAANWPSAIGHIRQLESFVRKSSFYFRVKITYQWDGNERSLSESWIPAQWWHEGTDSASAGNSVVLFIDPSDPDRAIWNPKYQSQQYKQRIAQERGYVIVGFALCLVFYLATRWLAKRPKKLGIATA